MAYQLWHLSYGILVIATDPRSKKRNGWADMSKQLSKIGVGLGAPALMVLSSMDGAALSSRLSAQQVELLPHTIAGADALERETPPSSARPPLQPLAPEQVQARDVMLAQRPLAEANAPLGLPERVFFKNISRSVPTVNAEHPCRSEGSARRRYPSVATLRFDLGVPRKVVEKGC